MGTSTASVTLTGKDYTADEVFELERERIFHRQWYYAGRAERAAGPGDRLVVDVAGESILVVRDRGGQLRAFYNVCSHRGSQLCDASTRGEGAAIICPYHGWSYSLRGELKGTPNVGKDEVDRNGLSLPTVSVEEWQGFVFVSLADDPPPLRTWLGEQPGEPLAFEEFGLGERRVVTQTVADVAANWKVLVENYSECLHCARVHPELVDLIPTYRSGGVTDHSRADGGVALSEESETFRSSGYAALAALDDIGDLDANAYYGAVVFPNMFIDITGASVVVSTLIPREPGRTTVVADYLFTPKALETEGFDPSPIVDFNEMVAKQDFEVCERVQRGVGSRAFKQNVYADKDAFAIEFVKQYLDARGPVAP